MGFGQTSCQLFSVVHHCAGARVGYAAEGTQGCGSRGGSTRLAGSAGSTSVRRANPLGRYRCGTTLRPVACAGPSRGTRCTDCGDSIGTRNGSSHPQCGRFRTHRCSDRQSLGRLRSLRLEPEDFVFRAEYRTAAHCCKTTRSSSGSRRSWVVDGWYVGGVRDYARSGPGGSRLSQRFTHQANKEPLTSIISE